MSAASAFAADSSELEQQTAIQPSDSDILLCIKDAMDKSNQGGLPIRSLQHVLFADKSTDTPDTTPDPTVFQLAAQKML